MRRTVLTTLALALSALASGAQAHDEAVGIDSYMLGEERFFQVIDQPAPPFDLVDADGSAVSLADLADKVVVLDRSEPTAWPSVGGEEPQMPMVVRAVVKRLRTTGTWPERGVVEG